MESYVAELWELLLHTERVELDELDDGAVLGDVEEGDLALVLALVSCLHRRDRQLSLGVVQAEAATGQQLAFSLKYF